VRYIDIPAMDDYGDGDAPPSPIKITAMNDDDGPLPPMPPGRTTIAANRAQPLNPTPQQQPNEEIISAH
jgi:hypothetical protein